MKSFKEILDENSAVPSAIAKMKAEMEAKKKAKAVQNAEIRKDVIKKTGEDPNKIYHVARGTSSMGG